ncbi:MAG: OadG family protein [Clostridia bacterium]|nr:OadG family protein [Clostridia bacterium]
MIWQGVYTAAQNGAGETASDIFSGAGLTTLIGMAVVFSVLLLLTLVFKLFGLLMHRAPKPAAAPAAPAAVPSPAAAGPHGVSPEIAAVIAGAVAAMEPEGVHYQVRRVVPAASSGQHPTWAQAGLLEQTRPF